MVHAAVFAWTDQRAADGSRLRPARAVLRTYSLQSLDYNMFSTELIGLQLCVRVFSVVLFVSDSSSVPLIT